MEQRTDLARGHRQRAGGFGDMLKLDLPLFILVGSVAAGVVVGFLDAQSYDLTSPGSFIGVWFAAGLSIAAIAVLPVLLVGLSWNAIVSRLLGRGKD